MIAASPRAAVLGSPISHSKSPQLHTAAYQHLGLDIHYSRIEVPEAQLEQFLAAEGTAPGWLGWSVTMPLKAAMVPQMTSVSPRVQGLGVLNTVVIGEDAQGERTLHGENTDVDGIVAALQEQGLPDDGPETAVFGVIGAGGTAAAALAAAAELKFSSEVIYARSPERAAAARPLAELLGLTLNIRPLEALSADIGSGKLGVVVSTLPPRTADSLVDSLPEQVSALRGFPILLDVAYDPWPSILGQAWTQRGGRVTSGLQMLLHQAVRQVELFTAHSANPAAGQDPVSHGVMVDKMRSSIGLA